MGKKGGANSKAEAAKEKKAAAKAEKDRAKAAEQEAREAEKWSQGAKGKGKKELEAEKKAAQKAKREELERLKVRNFRINMETIESLNLVYKRLGRRGEGNGKDQTQGLWSKWLRPCSQT